MGYEELLRVNNSQTRIALPLKWIAFGVATAAVIISFFLVKEPPLKKFDWSGVSNEWLHSIKKQKEQKSGAHWRFEGRSAEVELFAKATRTSELTAADFAVHQIKALKGLFQPSTQETDCSTLPTPKLIAIKKDNYWIKSLRLKAKRYNYVGCKRPEKNRDALWLALYCRPNQQLIEFKLFFDVPLKEKEMQRFFDSFACSQAAAN